MCLLYSQAPQGKVYTCNLGHPHLLSYGAPLDPSHSRALVPYETAMTDVTTADTNPEVVSQPDTNPDIIVTFAYQLF
jgi:hypothetical protein